MRQGLDGLDVARARRRLNVFEGHEAIVLDRIDIGKCRVRHHELSFLLGGHRTIVDDDDHFGVLFDNLFPSDRAPAFLQAVHDIGAARCFNQGCRHRIEPSREWRVFPAVIDENTQRITGVQTFGKRCQFSFVAIHQSRGFVFNIEDFTEVHQVRIHVIDAGLGLIHDVGAALGQFVDFDAKRGERLRGHFPAHFHAVVPAREEEISIGPNDHFLGWILGRQFRQFFHACAHFLVERLPAGNTGVAHHAIGKTQDQHHFRQVDVIRNGTLGRCVERNSPVAAFNSCAGKCSARAQAKCQSAIGYSFHSVDPR